MNKNSDKWPTEAELLLWRYLRLMRLKGLNFRRRERIGNYVVDFVCHEKRLVVEIDNMRSGTQNDPEQKRMDDRLISKGFRVLRFKPKDIQRDVSGVLEAVLKGISEPLPPVSAHHSNSMTSAVDDIDGGAAVVRIEGPDSMPEPANAISHLKYR